MSGVGSNNIFAALQQKKKKPSKAKAEPVESEVDIEEKHAELEKAIFSGAGASMSNWADSEDEFYHAENVGDEEGWNRAPISGRNSHIRLVDLQQPEEEEHIEESDEDVYDEEAHYDIEAELGLEVARHDDEEEDDDEEEEEEEEDDDDKNNNKEEGNDNTEADSLMDTAIDSSVHPADQAKTQRLSKQLSKKEREELKKKELEDLDAVLAELGLETKQGEETTLENGSGDASSSKAAKRKKKKAAASCAETHVEETQPEVATNGEGENGRDGPAMDAEAIKARKAALLKKKAAGAKKSAAQSAAAAAAAEAKAKAKKNKDKSRFNEMPTR